MLTKATFFEAECAILLVPVPQIRKVEVWQVRVTDGKQARGQQEFDDLDQAVEALGATIEQYPYAQVSIRKVRR